MWYKTKLIISNIKSNDYNSKHVDLSTRFIDFEIYYAIITAIKQPLKIVREKHD